MTHRCLKYAGIEGLKIYFDVELNIFEDEFHISEWQITDKAINITRKNLKKILLQF